MHVEASLYQRRRHPRSDELDGIPWLALLLPSERERAVEELRVGDAQAGDYVCRVGRPVTYWFGVVEGLLKMSSDSADGQTMTFTGVPPGGWFGEGTALKREVYRYNIQALRRSVVAGIPVDTFHWLLDHSIGFNRFVMNQLNERLGQFIAARETDRMNTPDHPAGAGLPGGAVAPAGERSPGRAAGPRADPCRIRRSAGAEPRRTALQRVLMVQSANSQRRRVTGSYRSNSR